MIESSNKKPDLVLDSNSLQPSEIHSSKKQIHGPPQCLHQQSDFKEEQSKSTESNHLMAIQEKNVRQILKENSLNLDIETNRLPTNQSPHIETSFLAYNKINVFLNEDKAF